MTDLLRIRPATLPDAEALLAIYRPFVDTSVISFETVPPALEEFAARIRKALASWQWLVAERAGQLIGYAYGSSHRERAAYRWSVEVSAYVSPSHHRQGVGRLLYSELLPISRAGATATHMRASRCPTMRVSRCIARRASVSSAPSKPWAESSASGTTSPGSKSDSAIRRLPSSESGSERRVALVLRGHARGADGRTSPRWAPYACAYTARRCTAGRPGLPGFSPSREGYES